MLGRNRLQAARQSAKDLVEEFIVEWLKANEKKE